MAKIIHITDSHVLADGSRLGGVDTLARLRQAVSHVSTVHADADLCVFTGDLVENGSAAEYQAFRDAVTPLRMPLCFTMGNHDNRDAFRTVFPNAQVDHAGFVQHDTVLESGAAALICVDTLAPGYGHGEICPSRFNWLAERLKAHAHRDALILMMHHPPIDLGMTAIDQAKLVDADRLQALIAQAQNVRLVCFGHAHRPVAGSWAGVSFVGGASVSVPIKLNLRDHAALEVSDDSPMFGVVVTRGRDVVYHFEQVR
jgi:3',5'-cyclic AMP phosphodiesterase CpdA